MTRLNRTGLGDGLRGGLGRRLGAGLAKFFTGQSDRADLPQISTTRQSLRAAVEDLEVRRLFATVFRMNAGGPDIIDSANFLWQADTFASGGAVSNNIFPVGNTVDDALYSDRRRGTEFNYNIPVANGNYLLRLDFVEPLWKATGKRVMDVSAEGAVIFNDLDLFAVGGFRNAVVLQTALLVTDGTLNLNFKGVIDTAILSAIQLQVDGNASLDKTVLYFNEPAGGDPSQPQVVTLTNTGAGPLSVSQITQPFMGSDPSMFVTGGNLGATVLQAGQSLQFLVAFNPPEGALPGVKNSFVRVVTDDPDQPLLDIAVRGLSTTGIGGANEPSLQRVLDLYQIPVQTGDPLPDTTELQRNTQPIGSSDEIVAPFFVRVGTGPVTIQPLAVFGVESQPALYMGWYESTSDSALHQLARVPTSSAQTVSVELNGSVQFDPGSAAFGLYTTWPGFWEGNALSRLTSKQRMVYQSDALNTFERTAVNQHKMRTYPLKDAGGNVVPDAYVIAFEEFGNDVNGSYDYQDFVAVIRNVRPAVDGRLTLDNRDGGGTFDNWIGFAGIAQRGDNTVKTSSILRINNTGGAPVTVNSLVTTGTFSVTGAPTTPFVIQPGAFVDFTVNFTATTTGIRTGTLVVNSDEPSQPVITVQLRGDRVSRPESGAEPPLKKIVQTLFGYTTDVGNQTMLARDAGAVLPVGEEIISPYWVQADAGQRIYVRMLAAYHTQNKVSQLYTFPEADPNFPNAGNAPIMTQTRADSQTILPRKNANGTPTAEAYFDMGPDAAFGFAVRDGGGTSALYYSFNQLNDGKPGAPDLHLIRFFPARDPSGEVIPDTYLMAVDYNGINFDYQDGIYVVSNIRPKDLAAAPMGVGLGNFGASVVVTWARNLESNVLGYNVFRAASPTGARTLLNALPVSGTQLVDFSPPPAQKVYYFVTAVTPGGVNSVGELETIITL